VTADWNLAVSQGDVARLRALVEAGADVNARNRRGQTALMVSAQKGQASVVRFLIDRGAELNHTAKYTLSALMLAVINGHVETVQLLTDAGADLTIRGSGAPGFHGKTAEDLAIARGNHVMSEIVRRRGTRPS